MPVQDRRETMRQNRFVHDADDLVHVGAPHLPTREEVGRVHPRRRAFDDARRVEPLVDLFDPAQRIVVGELAPAQLEGDRADPLGVGRRLAVVRLQGGAARGAARGSTAAPEELPHLRRLDDDARHRLAGRLVEHLHAVLDEVRGLRRVVGRTLAEAGRRRETARPPKPGQQRGQAPPQTVLPHVSPLPASRPARPRPPRSALPERRHLVTPMGLARDGPPRRGIRIGARIRIAARATTTDTRAGRTTGNRRGSRPRDEHRVVAVSGAWGTGAPSAGRRNRTGPRSATERWELRDPHRAGRSGRRVAGEITGPRVARNGEASFRGLPVRPARRVTRDQRSPTFTLARR